ncbi:hypothetical protein P175DRAFT_0500377 [Aspergillus ochraceoroseus IBT 24754]|uniref:DNA-directed RNA polymerase III subunit RPC9 n=3 Tax=Aspergillus subgen. Nidulantes TaxID=2720870 RepID=A0A0F8UKB9_9EURO|nr:uncharacterized protein P175DRAFT_0500377 [Aspergillus ochraceoroseus IBT 24754]KKK16826.1 hypothetical protein AOCH_005149 [Aspergillus ochraceoroseus]KKK20074.1 hypothetical protein ARAM_005433 [Aspergillus rambellii]PTU21487.1 hypothetical protein P175DRAFT_0500377 [Aspergillus ochraceoroseus IBT 24754]
MRIINPQEAVLTNVEVLAYLTANPPRRPPNPPPSSRHWVPSPDLRDHNTVVKEIHNYVSRLSPHILKYPRYTTTTSTTQTRAQKETETPLDGALRALVTRLQPYGLTKGEVLMIVNLGVGIDSSASAAENTENAPEGGEEMDVDGADEQQTGQEGDGEGEGGEQGEGGEEEEDPMAGDYGALALLDTVIEEREERLSQEDVGEVLAIIRETF